MRSPFTRRKPVIHPSQQLDKTAPQTGDELLPLVYEELRKLAALRLSRETPGQTLQPTALVHEAYLRLMGSDGRDWNGRGHFFMAAAEAMRRILIERARRKKRLKHGGAWARADVDVDGIAAVSWSVDLLALDRALAKLAAAEPEKAELVKLRYFAGLTIPQAAQALGVSVATAGRHWKFARGWLFAELTRDGLSALDDFHEPWEFS